MADNSRSQEPAWTFNTRANVQRVAVPVSGALCLIADGNNAVHILSETGAPRGTFKCGKPVGTLRSAHQASLFATLAGNSIIYAFNADGQLEWRVELAGPLADFDMDAACTRVVATTNGPSMWLYSPASRDRKAAALRRPASAVCVTSGDPFMVLVADATGYLAMLNADAELQWDTDLKSPIGRPSLSSKGSVIAVPAQEKGVLLYDLDGVEAGVVELDAPAKAAILSAGGTQVMVETADDRLVLAQTDGGIVWDLSIGGPIASWGFGADGGLVLVTAGGKSASAYRLREPAPGKAGPGKADVAKGPPAEAVGETPRPKTAAPPELGKLLLDEVAGKETAEAPIALDAVPPRPPAPVKGEKPRKPVQAAVPAAPPAGRPAPRPPKKAHVLWKKRLPASVLPPLENGLRVNRDGSFVVSLLHMGTVFTLDSTGELTAKTAVRAAGHIAPSWLDRALVVWSIRDIVLMEPAVNVVREVPLREAPLRFLDASTDLSLICTVDESGMLSALRGSMKPAWQFKPKDDPTGLFVSPDGNTVMVADGGNRFRYYDASGQMTRKFRFPGDSGKRALALSNEFSVFEDQEGLITVIDQSGREVWAQRLYSAMQSVDLFGPTLAIYGPNGACAAVDPAAGTVHKYEPPAGRTKVRWPAGGHPMVVHVADNIVTLYSGDGGKLERLWQSDCAAKVDAFDADERAAIVIAVAGERMYRLSSEGS